MNGAPELDESGTFPVLHAQKGFPLWKLHRKRLDPSFQRINVLIIKTEIDLMECMSSGPDKGFDLSRSSISPAL